MNENRQPIYFIGGGAIATSMGNVLSKKPELDITILSIENNVVNSINALHENLKYFPNFKLEPALKASDDFSMLVNRAIVFLAIPSVAIVNFLKEQKIHPESIIVNLAKGFGNERKTIVECMEAFLPNPLCTLKGPSFAREIINNQHTAFTLGARNGNIFNLFEDIFSDTTIHIDHTDDIQGVEFLSILKNIYAIVIGIVDAQYESPNLKFMIFTKALGEMRQLLLHFGGRKKTLFNYCGIGDYALTALNDLSRNRTLGLLIGKGFFTDYISEKVVLEGRIAVNVFHEELQLSEKEPPPYPILKELHKVFSSEYDISKFVGNLLEQPG